MNLAELPLPPQVITNCRECHTDLPAGALVCPQCNTLVYGHHLEQITKAASNLEESTQPNHLAEARELWLSAIPLLPRASRQAEWIRQRVLTLDTRIHNADASPPTNAKAQSRWVRRI